MNWTAFETEQREAAEVAAMHAAQIEEFPPMNRHTLFIAAVAVVCAMVVSYFLPLGFAS